MSHSVFTIVTTIKPGCLTNLKGVLGDIERSHANNDHLRFPQFATLHFASFVIFEDSWLVFENNVDSPIDPYIKDLIAAGPGIDAIYNNCEGWNPAAPPDVKHEYLRSHVRKPQLYHVGTPYRVAASIKTDRDLHAQLDRRLDTLMAHSLPRQLGTAVGGTREYWTWEQVKPWIAWPIGGLASWLALWLMARTHWTDHRWGTNLLLLLFDVGVASVGLLFALKLWFSALPDLRDQVPQWIRWAMGGLLWMIVWMLWADHRRRAVLLLLIFAAWLLLSVAAAVRRARNQRLEQISAGDRQADSAASIWQQLQSSVSASGHQKRSFGERVRNWSVVFGGWAIVSVGIFSLWGHHRWLSVVLTTIFLLEALWLIVLVGWPAPARALVMTRKDALALLGFVLVAGISGWGLSLLPRASWFGSSWLAIVLGLVVLIALFSLWNVRLPSPRVPVQEVSRDRLAEIVDQEDRDVQNHMAALVPLRPAWFRAPLLRVFLWALNRVFYRTWLPDIEHGKLFGIPTVHFAQWVLLDDRRFVFLSNYDHSWTAYLNDFGERLTTGLQKVWGQGERNPGVQDLWKFKEFVRAVMVPHSVWYSAYPGLTVRQIWNNEHIRRELSRDVGEDTMVKVLRRFASAPKIPHGVFHGRIS